VGVAIDLLLLRAELCWKDPTLVSFLFLAKVNGPV
jgi:hypothetical protein